MGFLSSWSCCQLSVPGVRTHAWLCNVSKNTNIQSGLHTFFKLFGFYISSYEFTILALWMVGLWKKSGHSHHRWPNVFRTLWSFNQEAGGGCHAWVTTGTFWQTERERERRVQHGVAMLLWSATGKTVGPQTVIRPDRNKIILHWKLKSLVVNIKRLVDKEKRDILEKKY